MTTNCDGRLNTDEDEVVVGKVQNGGEVDGTIVWRYIRVDVGEWRCVRKDSDGLEFRVIIVWKKRRRIDVDEGNGEMDE